MTFKLLFIVALPFKMGISPARALDPQTLGAFSVVGSLHTARQLHMPTLLSAGRVLAAGGIDDTYHTVTTPEVYDPAAATWTVSGPLKNPRHSASATLLPNVAGNGFTAFPRREPLPRGHRWQRDQNLVRPA